MAVPEMREGGKVAGSNRSSFQKINICSVCGYCFVFREVTPTGFVRIIKHHERKLKLTTERMKEIREVISGFEPPRDEKRSSGVCQQCHRNVVKAMKKEMELQNMKQHLKESYLHTQSVLSQPPIVDVHFGTPSTMNNEMERSVYIPWSLPTHQQSDDDTGVEPTGQDILTLERPLTDHTVSCQEGISVECDIVSEPELRCDTQEQPDNSCIIKPDSKVGDYCCAEERTSIAMASR